MLTADSSRRRNLSGFGRAVMCLVALALLCWPALSSAQSIGTLPGVRFGAASLMTPDAAATYYNGQPTTVTYPWGTTRPPEIVETARSLGNDPDRMFAFVRNNIKVVPMYGLQKGAMGVLIDRSGTAFDQAQLLVELLRAGGFPSARYVIGDVTLSGTQLESWLGTKKVAAVSSLLANGGIPATIAGTTDVTSITMGHVWVQVEVGGVTRTLDPTFKASTRYIGISVPTAAAFNTTTFVTTATTATVSTENGASYIQSVNISGIESALTTASTSLLTDLRTTDKDKADEEIVGGDRIQYVDAPGVTPTTGTLTARWTFTGGMPDRFRTKLSVQADTCSASFFVDEIYGRRLTIHRQMSAVTSPVNGIYVDGALVGSGCATLASPQNLAVTVTANHPYAANSGAYMDATTIKYVDFAEDVYIVHGWGDTSPALQGKLATEATTERDEKKPDPQEGVMPDGSAFVQSDAGTSGVSTKAKLASSWLAQVNRTKDILEGITGVWFQHQHTLGVAYSQGQWLVYDTNKNGVIDSGETTLSPSPKDSAMRLDLDSGFSTTSLNASSADELGARHTLAAAMAALEGSVMEQQLDAVDVSSGAQRIPWGQENLASTIRYHLFTAGTAAPTVTTYRGGATASGLACVGAASTTDGFNVVQANDRALGPGQGAAPPTAWTTLNPWLPQTQATMHRGCAWIAFKADGSQIIHMVTSLDRGLKGGGAGTDPVQQETFKPEKQADLLKDQFKDRSFVDGVDLRTGAFTYTPDPDITVGQGEAPYQLTFQRTFQAGSQHCPGCSFGWTHNFDIRAMPSGGGLEGMGSGTPLALAGPMVALQAAYSVYRAGPNALSNQIAGEAIMRWYTRQLSNNVITVTMGAQSETFVRLVDGTFAPPRGSGASLAKTGERHAILEPGARSYSWKYDTVSYVRTGPSADTISFAWRQFNPSTTLLYPKAKAFGFFATTWAFPRGANLTFSYCESTGSLAPQQTEYTCRDRLTRVTNSLGLYINIDRLNATSSDGRSTTIVTSATTALADTYDPESEMPTSFTDVLGQVWTYQWQRSGTGDRPSPYPHLVKVFKPGDTTNAILQLTYDHLGAVREYRDGEAVLGNRPAVQFRTPGFGYGQMVDGMGGILSIVYDDHDRQIRQIDELGRISLTTYDGWGRVRDRVAPEGNIVRFTYDGRGNVTELRRIPKPGSVLPEIAITAGWNATWNKPAWIIDPYGAQTDFTYFTTGGGKGELQSVQRPAPTSGASRPTYSFTYNTVGQVLTAADPTGVVITNAYTSGFLTSTTTSASGFTATTSFTNNSRGDALSIDGPRTDVTDVSYTTYDAMRRKRIEISADPDGAGALPRLMSRTTYDVLGRITTVEKGTGVATDGSDLSVAQTAMSTLYDAANNKVRETTPAGITQYSYDANNRVVCGAVRMNPAVYASLPADACALGTAGAYGPDRISKSLYDAAGQLTATLQALGTGDQRTYGAYSYTLNGQQETITDARANRSTLEYDGFDRLLKLRFPVTTVGALASSTTDYEQYGYDAGGRRTSVRRRDAQVINYGYDALGREILKDIPGGTAADVYTGYDAASRVLYSRFGSTAGQGVDYGFDTAGRLTSESTFGRAMTYQYDTAGNRTRVTWPDTLYVAYGYDALNRTTTVGENGAASGLGLLATYAYDTMGRRATVTRGNGVVTTYGYDGADRLTSQGLDAAGSASDLTLGFTPYNPASQLMGRSVSNDAYIWRGHPTTTVNTTADGLNRDAAIAAMAGGYDARGNLTSDGSRTFTYDVENRLLTVGGSSSLSLGYDPLGRLTSTVSGATTTQFLYAGSALVGEYPTSGAAPLRRYVHGPGVDEPLVWYEGAATADRRWLLANAQGSVIGQAGDAGTVTQIYTYGPYGEPKDWTGSRFRYTGQIMLPEAQLYHYKARVYDPVTGRFLQTDPIGYGDDLDLYAYVGGDPVDKADPTGLLPAEVQDLLPNLPSPAQGQQFAGALGKAWGNVVTAVKEDPVGAAITAVGVIADLADSEISPGPDFSVGADVVNAARAAKAEANAADAAAAARRATCCFVAGTLVATDGGMRPIESIAIGDLVLSRDEVSGETRYKPVEGLVRRHDREIFEVVVEVAWPEHGTTIEKFSATDDHPWMSIDGVWVSTIELKSGLGVVTANGISARILRVTKTGRVEFTYNLEVADYHTYFVGRSFIWVHNACDPKPPKGGHDSNKRESNREKHEAGDARRRANQGGDKKRKQEGWKPRK